MRLFIAIDFDEQKDYFLKLQEEIKDSGHYSFPKSFHLTIKFLGEVEGAEQLKTKLSTVKFDSFESRLGSFGAFPTQPNPRVIWVAAEPKEKFNELHKKLGAAGILPDETRFEPHITLARVKQVKDKDKLAKFFNKPVDTKEISVNSVKLIQSTLMASGPVYETLFTQKAQNI